jgi:hypothetical protein
MTAPSRNGRRRVAALVEKSVGGAENTVGRRLTYAQTLAKRNPQLCGIAVGFLLGVGK